MARAAPRSSASESGHARQLTHWSWSSAFLGRLGTCARPLPLRGVLGKLVRKLIEALPEFVDAV
jgi:hypothetical protein